MKTSPRWQSGLLYLLAWLALGLANASIAQAATIATPVPTVTLTAPTDGATYIAPASITLSATASETGGTIAKVEFYSGTTLLGTSTSSPYTLTLTNVAAGSYTYSATAYDSLGVSATSTSASVTVNPVSTVPTVTLTAPTDGATYIAPASITLSATASETGGTIAKVEFYNGTTLLGTSTTTPYTLTVTNIAAGSYTYSATAYDSLGVSATSTSASVTVNPVSTAPTVTLTAPTDGATYIAPASVTLSATAAESGGTISRVDFYSGPILLAAATAVPYSYTWSNIPVGSYTFTAVATDIRNVSATSSPVSVTIGAAPATPIYYIYTDQLNTPRLITDTANSVVWRNDQADPFNASAPYDDPGNTGHHFVFNLRFPGQYYDQETGLAYNYYRDYDANTGRYVQSDPIGLNGGLNTYGYANQNPLKYTDPDGLDPDPLSSPSGSGGFSPAPTPFDVFIPGTPANNSFVKSTTGAINAISQMCKDGKQECLDNCYAAYLNQVRICKMAPTAKGRAQCYARANDLHGQCRAGCK
ncbi:MAG TPA: Ig-like domain-containing protein [Sulfuriferula sp.]|nr:Ig-like domain-containing protein [Sulfuriferula sp.]